jgi:hypothetical protein
MYRIAIFALLVGWLVRFVFTFYTFAVHMHTHVYKLTTWPFRKSSTSSVHVLFSRDWLNERTSARNDEKRNKLPNNEHRLMILASTSKKLWLSYGTSCIHFSFCFRKDVRSCSVQKETNTIDVHGVMFSCHTSCMSYITLCTCSDSFFCHSLWIYSMYKSHQVIFNLVTKRWRTIALNWIDAVESIVHRRCLSSRRAYQ